MDQHTDSESGVAHPSSSPFVVGLGASAGGIEALRKFFAAVPSDSNSAYVVILHLSPDHDSRLAEVLQHTASTPVTQVLGTLPLEPNHVYVVPPNKLLCIQGSNIDVAEITRAEQRRAPVDMFFRSLADARGTGAVCVILSGTGPNGSVGLRRVKECGGLVVAQQPDEAEHGEMPRNAIATGLVDLVLPVQEIPRAIAGYFQRLRGDGDEATETVQEADPQAMREILAALRMRTGHDFASYKSGTIQRRVERRIQLRGLPSISAYARMIRENADEAAGLMKELLISVTSFFRDPAAFEALTHKAIPRIFHNKTSSDQVRVWVPACATGEEAYSLAILLAEHASTSLDQPAIQVFATDLDEHAVQVAREGFYIDAEVADLSSDRLQRFFSRESGGYRVRRDVREIVLFAHHNLIRDPPFSHLDLISCRNLLIYLNRSIQERLMETFHFALRPGGHLFLGTSESPDGTGHLFATVDKNAHIYESRPVGTRVALPLTDHRVALPSTVRPAPEVKSAERISPAELHHRLLERYAPPSVVITEEHNLVHVSEKAARYLTVAAGEPTRDLLRLVRPDLRPDLRSAIHEALEARSVVSVKGVRLELDNEPRAVDLTVHPVLREADPAHGYLLITFDERTGDDAQAGLPHVERPSEPQARGFEEEQARLRQQLRTTVEQYETQVEEAKASNEELQAMNEELRSAAEELETSKEELQSVNEELTTVNQELKIKIEELGLKNNDFQNLINSSDVGTIFLDRKLQVKMSTPAANQIFNLRSTDAGRPLTDITSHLRYDSLTQDVAQVLNDLRTVDRELETRDGHWILTCLRPYRTTDDRIDGVVITFQDITDRRAAEARVRMGEERLRLLVDGATDYAIFTMTPEGIIDTWNSGAERMYRYRADEIVGRPFATLFTSEDRASGMPERELQAAAASGRVNEERFQMRQDGSRLFCSGTTIRLGESLGFAKIARDSSIPRQAAEALRLVQAEFEARLRTRTGELEAEIEARAEAHRHVTALLKKLVTAQEDERARIARDLHDQLGQQLTALHLSLQRHRQRLEAEHVDSDLQRALDLVDRLDHDIDYLSWDLRPAVLDDLGLAAALPLFVREWSAHSQIPAECRLGGFAAGQISNDAEVVFYRVAQEALNNVSKHAHASRVDVLLESRDGTVTLVIEDDGVGFEPADQESRDLGVGLVGMQERASLIGAALQIESQPGRGTSIYLRTAKTASGSLQQVE